jgi:plastocyanin
VRALALPLAVLFGLPAMAATHTVTMEAMKFQPETITVKRGDKVVWVNKDVVPHTATAARRFDSKNIAAGQSWTWKAGKAGRYEYLCTYHPGMKGVVEVK